MQNTLSFFQNLNISRDEFQSIKDGLDCMDLKEATRCVELLVLYGYPKTEIRDLILVNPQILLYSPTLLEEKLKTLGDDIEDKLKNDPFLI